MPAIHQFHGSSSVGDAITKGLFYTRDLLRSLGFSSEVYCEDIAPELADQIKPAATFPDHEDTVLLVHFSWAIRYFHWLRGLKCRKALVYHNITPTEFFEDEGFATFATRAQAQLADLLKDVDAVVTVSAYNAREIASLGWPGPIDVVPMLFDPDRLEREPYDEELLSRLRADESFKILYVGRIVTNKRQTDLLHVIDRLRHISDRPVRLTLPGGLGAGAAYRDQLIELRARLHLDDIVDLPGKVSDRELYALYRGSNAMLCLSEHEGFCVPLVEAMKFDLPVIAFESSAVSETVGSGGLVIDDKDPVLVAALLKTLSEEPALRRRLVMAGRRNVERFSRRQCLAGLSVVLRERFGIDCDPPAPAATSATGSAWRLEGPFDSSYSLALVNRSLATALHDSGVDVGLHSTEGPGDFAPNEAFLAEQPLTRKLWERGRDMTPVDVVLRDLYPPRVTGMAAPTRVLSAWAWEESGLPAEWVASFNRELDLITVLSTYVARVLVDNGVRTPIAVVGCGTDHLGHSSPQPPPLSLGQAGFRFLHISSGFPRKGLDVLLEAWGKAFSRQDDVVLVIKTFANPHNDLSDRLRELAGKFPDHAEIVRIDTPFTDAEMAGLYRSCHALVAPSRGEGFGLPVAEAMLQGVPAITTRHGGVLDYCSDASAWLVDYQFAYAQTHFGLFDSVWAEPVVEDLVRALQQVLATTPEDRARRASEGRAKLQDLTWRAVAERTRAAVASLEHRPAVSTAPAVAWVSTWNTKCGIAAYSRFLAAGFPPGSLQIFADRATELVRPDEPFVRRCWQQGSEDDLEALHSAIRSSGATAAVFQFNFSLFDFDAFARLLCRLTDGGVRCHVTLHSTGDVDYPGRTVSLRQIRAALGGVARILVHSVNDLNTLKAFDLVDNVTLFPHGSVAPAPAAGRNLPLAIELADRKRRQTILATFGYLLPNKGLPRLLRAFASMRQRRQDLHLLMLNAPYPAPGSQSEAELCRRTIVELGLESSVTFVNSYQEEPDALALLSHADLIVYSYDRTQESSSAAVRFGLASGRPVACTPLAIFDDVRAVVHTLPGTEPDDIAEGLLSLIEDRAVLESRSDLQAQWQSTHDWSVLSKRLWNMLCATGHDF